MLSENRKFNYEGEIILKRSKVLGNETQPKDDKVNWLFLDIGEHQYSFVYKIENKVEAVFDEPFKIKLAFTMVDTVKKIIELNHNYKVSRGQEMIGSIELINEIE